MNVAISKNKMPMEEKKSLLGGWARGPTLVESKPSLDFGSKKTHFSRLPKLS
jgi:hypothetical protein